jgi:hypothetical protein
MFHKTESMNKYLRNTSLFLFIIGVTGCASPPRLVDAEIPLVTPRSYVSTELIPYRYWSKLDNALETQFVYKDYLVQMSAPYDSALGTHCRQLRFSLDGEEVGSRVACAQKSKQAHKSLWFLTKNIVHKNTVVSLK